MAQFNVGICLANGWGVEKDIEQAAHYFLLSAVGGYVNAMYKIGLYAYNGTGIPQNYQNAVHWWQLAANKGDLDSMIALGECYNDGKGVNVNIDKAIELYSKAKEGGKILAMNRLAHIYSDVKGYCDYQLAFKLYKESAEKGNVNSMACLGWCYHYGNGIEKNLKEALNWYEKAGCDWSKKKIEAIKSSYEWKLIVARDAEEKANNGDAQYMCQLGMWYQYGENNMPQNTDKAIYWYQKASMTGNVAALNFMNMLLKEREAKEAEKRKQEEDNRLAEMQKMLEAERKAKEEAERKAMSDRNAKEEAERRAKKEASGKLTVNGFEYLGRYTIYCSYEHSEWYYDNYMNRSREHKEKIWDTSYAENEDDKNAKVDVYMKPVGGSIIYRVKGSTGKIYQISRGKYQTKTGFALESKETYAYDEIPKAIYEYETFNSKYINCHGVEIRLNV